MMRSNNDDEGLDLGVSMVEVMDEPPGGTGVNATEINDPLCELVWSAQSGVSLNKCADSGQKPLLLWNVWPEINKEKLIKSPEIPDVISESGEKGAAISMSSRDMQSRQESDEEVNSTCGKARKNQVVAPIPVLNSGGAEDCLRLEKGKDKAVLSNERTESSCNRGVKRRKITRIRESRTISPCFANWISTLVKGRRVIRKSGGTDSPDSGFHSVFQSLYNPNKSQESKFNIPDEIPVFAKALNALKRVTTQLEDAESSSACCCFCGEGGHDLRKCPRLTEAELHGLLGKLDSLEGDSCLCLKCLRLGHWAVSCPDGDADVARAVRKLRLSRDDVLRMMKSDDVSLDGFFLRLRFRDSGYYVARITGCESSKSISVDVGGIKSCVASQYISNHDFVEGEIEAWWGGTVRAGGKVPSLDELKAKIEDRTRLGFSSRPHDS